jgi:hypothetical protein
MGTHDRGSLSNDNAAVVKADLQPNRTVAASIFIANYYEMQYERPSLLNVDLSSPKEAGIMIPRIVLYVIVSWLIAAHFLRSGSLIFTALCLATPLLFLLRRRWSLLLLRCLAYAAAAIWLVTAWQIVAERRFFGQPWLRAAAILVAVAAVSTLAGVLLRGPTVQQRYRGR